eukprot:1160137-Pelagomonas_calceolata.AAC.12
MEAERPSAKLGGQAVLQTLTVTAGYSLADMLNACGHEDSTSMHAYLCCALLGGLPHRLGGLAGGGSLWDAAH